MMKKGCGTVVFREYELDRTLAAIREAGFEYFETQATNPWCNHVVLAKDDPIKLAELAKKHGFKGITSLWPLEGNLLSSKDTCIGWVTKAIEFAAAAGIPVVDFGDGSKPKDMSEEDAFKRLEDRLLQVLEVAEKHKVTMALEPHGTFSLTKEGLHRILSISDSKYLGINYDAANMRRAGFVETRDGVAVWRDLGDGASEYEVLESVIDRVVHFHAKDIDVNKKCVALGEGIVELEKCIEILKKHGYKGAISLETEGGMPFEVSLDLAKRSSAYLDKHLA